MFTYILRRDQLQWYLNTIYNQTLEIALQTAKIQDPVQMTGRGADSQKKTEPRRIKHKAAGRSNTWITRHTSLNDSSIICSLLLLCQLSAVSACSSATKPSNEKQVSVTANSEISTEPQSAQIINLKENQLPKIELRVTTATIQKNSSVYETFLKAGISGSLIQKIVAAAKPLANMANIKPQTLFQLYWSDSQDAALKKLKYPLSRTEDLILFENNGSWRSNIRRKQVEKRLEKFQGTVSSSLWNSAIDAGISGVVIGQLADVFAWQIDFSREIRNGDRWRLVIERKFVEGEPIGWGNILAAEFTNAGEKFVAIRYKSETRNRPGYFDESGESLRKIFLKSPVRFSRITSGFSNRRMHPILKINRPHHGVDYGAARGTPVRAVGDGKISSARYSRSSGNYIKISHNSKYSTSYHHLKNFARGIRRGKEIHQGDIIGYVGSTGLATGPHLHFAFYENGRYVDPLGMKFPSADPIKKSEFASFQAVAETIMPKMPNWSSTRIAKVELEQRRTVDSRPNKSDTKITSPQEASTTGIKMNPQTATRP